MTEQVTTQQTEADAKFAERIGFMASAADLGFSRAKEDFENRFVENPEQAINWYGESLVAAQTVYEITFHTMSVLNHPHGGVAEARKSAEQEIVRLITDTAHSTSSASRMIAAAKREAAVKVAEGLGIAPFVRSWG